MLLDEAVPMRQILRIRACRFQALHALLTGAAHIELPIDTQIASHVRADIETFGEATTAQNRKAATSASLRALRN